MYLAKGIASLAEMAAFHSQPRHPLLSNAFRLLPRLLSFIPMHRLPYLSPGHAEFLLFSINWNKGCGITVNLFVFYFFSNGWNKVCGTIVNLLVFVFQLSGEKLSHNRFIVSMYLINILLVEKWQVSILIISKSRVLYKLEISNRLKKCKV